MIFGEVLQGIVSQDVAGDILRRFGFVERNAGEMVVLVVVVVRAEGHVLRCYLRHHTRRHDVIGVDGVEPHEVREDLILVLVHHSFFLADIHHRQDLFTADRGVVFVIGDHSGDEFYEPDQGVKHEDQDPDDACGKAHEFAPVGRTDNFRDDLSEKENEDGGDSGYESEPLAAEDRSSLHTYAGGTDCVGDRIQREDRR